MIQLLATALVLAFGGVANAQTVWSTEADICTVEQAMQFGDRAPILITIEGEMTLEGLKSFGLWSYETGCEWEFMYVARTGRHAVGDGACWAEGERLNIAPVGFEFRDGGRVYLYGDQQDEVFGVPARLYPCPNKAIY